MKRLVISAFALLLASGASADYQRGFYAGLGVARVTGDDRTAFEDAELPVVELIGGYKYNSALGLELRLGHGPEDDADEESNYFLGAAAVTPGLTAIDRALEQFTALYYRPELINEDARLYGLLGYARVETEVTGLAGLTADEELFQQSETMSGLSYGMGVGWFIDEHFSLNVEYRRLLQEDDFRFKTVAVNLEYRF